MVVLRREVGCGNWTPLRVGAAEETGRWVKEQDEGEEEEDGDHSAATGRGRGSRAGVTGDKSGVMLGRSRSTKYEERGRAQGSSIHNFCYRFVGGGDGDGGDGGGGETEAMRVR